MNPSSHGGGKGVLSHAPWPIRHAGGAPRRRARHAERGAAHPIPRFWDRPAFGRYGTQGGAVFRRNEVLAGDGAGPVGPPAPRSAPRPSGEPGASFEPRPMFRAALRGYDRPQVDDYVAWADTELLAVRRANDDLLTRYGACSAELEISR